MSSDDRTPTALAPTGRARILDGPVVVEVRDVEKTFRIPTNRVDSLKERATHPLARREYRELHAVRGVSFDVHKGEFFGIVGRNGSGKSTLLKILASIYRADAGTVRMAGRLAPFIELGVGFNPELTSRENVVLNGVLLGLSRREAQRQLDSVLDFAGLQEFADLKLKNYSSGMMVRLAFAVMVEADADIMLIDEVLAVGDAAFAQKCMDVFREKRATGKTLVLVTHDMSTVQSLCDRAMLIHDGEMRYIGDPEEAALRYYRLNFAHADRGGLAHGLHEHLRGVEVGGGDDANGGADQEHGGFIPDVNAKLIDAWLENEAGERTESVEQGDPIRFNVVVESRHDLQNPFFTFNFHNVDGVAIFGFSSGRDVGDGQLDRLDAGQRVRIAAKIENPLVPGRYFVNCWLTRNRSAGDLALQVLRLLDFYVYGTKPSPGSVSVNADVEAILDPDAAP